MVVKSHQLPVIVLMEVSIKLEIILEKNITQFSLDHTNVIIIVPDSPSNFKAIEIGKTNLTLQWDIPWIFNGELKSFILNIEEMSSADPQACCESFTPVEMPFVDEQPIYTKTVLIQSYITNFPKPY